ncbi:MAG: DUF5723 family protein [Chitinophagales bacterium]|nr:DUF5723 family protein [Chitinophagales bacterium]
MCNSQDCSPSLPAIDLDMMNKCAVFFFFLILNFISASAQNNDSLSSKKILLLGWNEMKFSSNNGYENNFSGMFNHELEVSGSGVDHSSSLILPFSASLITKDFLDEEKKQDASNGLHDFNVLELGYNFNFSYRWMTDKFLYHDLAVYAFSYNFGLYSNTKFTHDLFNTIFFGNAMYAGQTADFSKSSNYDFQYDKISFSAQKKITTLESTWEFGTGISILGVHSLTKFDVPRGSLFTEQNGEYLDADFNYEYLTSDSTNHGNFQIDGVGAALDFQFSSLSKNQQTRWSFYLNDFGFANWNKNARTYSADSSIHFQGIEVIDLLSPDDSSSINFNVDSLLKNTGGKLETGSRSTLLPYCIALVFQHSVSQKIILNAGISYRPVVDLIPFIFVKPQWVINSTFQIAGTISYGGTASYALGADAYLNMNDRLKLNLGSDNILGIFIPKQTTSTSLFLRMRYLF